MRAGEDTVFSVNHHESLETFHPRTQTRLALCTVSSRIGRVFDVFWPVWLDVLGVFLEWRGVGELFVGISVTNMAYGREIRPDRGGGGGVLGSHPMNRMVKVQMSPIGPPRYPMDRRARLP